MGEEKKMRGNINKNQTKPNQTKTKKNHAAYKKRSLETASEDLSHIPVPPNSHFPGLKEHNQFIEVKVVPPPGQVQRQRVTRSNQMDLTSVTFPPQCLAHHKRGIEKSRGCLSQLARKICGFKWPQILQRGGSTVSSLLTGPPPHPPPLR